MSARRRAGPGVCSAVRGCIAVSTAGRRDLQNIKEFVEMDKGHLELAVQVEACRDVLIC